MCIYWFEIDLVQTWCMCEYKGWICFIRDRVRALRRHLRLHRVRPRAADARLPADQRSGWTRHSGAHAFGGSCAAKLREFDIVYHFAASEGGWARLIRVQ